MKVAVLVNKANFERYSAPGAIPEDWTLVHFGNDAPSEDKIIEFDADAILADAMLPVSAKVIEGSKHLKLVHSQGVGFNMIDLEAAKKAGVFVCNCAGANATAVAEQAVLLMLALLRHLCEYEQMIYAGKQSEAKASGFRDGLVELGACHVGIVGMGAIGRETAKRLKAFDCRISYYDVYEAKNCEIPRISLEEILKTCDIISLHAPVTPETTNMINDAALDMMKPGAILINTARGELVDQEALCRALISGKLGGAGLDVLTPEPVLSDNPVLNLPAEVRARVALSPHIGGITAGSFFRYYETIWKNMKRVNDGDRPVNIVNGL